MKKLCVVIFHCFLLISKIHAIGVRQLQEFNTAKKEVEQTLQLYRHGKSVSDESREKLEKNLALIGAVDKKAADSYRVQMPAQIEMVKKEVFEPKEKFINTPKESEEKVDLIPLSQKLTSNLTTINEVDEDIQIAPSTPRNIGQEIAQQPQQEAFSVQSVLSVPVVTSEPEVRETLVAESQSAWSVPVPKEQKKVEQKKQKDTILAQLKTLESAVDQAHGNLQKSDFKSENKSLSGTIENFSRWDRSVDNYFATLQALKSIDSEFYQEKTEKIKKINQLLVTKFYERTLLVIELICQTIEPLRKILKVNNEKKPGWVSGNKQEFQNASYEVFFGSLDKELWRDLGTRKNVPWFKGNVQKTFEMYWNQNLVQCSNLLFKYHNTQQSMTGEQSDMLKAKITALHEDIKQYKTLLSEAYNAMIIVLKSLPADDQKNQMKLIEKEYENHLKLLDNAYNALKKDFLNKLWPESNVVV